MKDITIYIKESNNNSWIKELENEIYNVLHEKWKEIEAVTFYYKERFNGTYFKVHFYTDSNTPPKECSKFLEENGTGTGAYYIPNDNGGHDNLHYKLGFEANNCDYYTLFKNIGIKNIDKYKDFLIGLKPNSK